MFRHRASHLPQRLAAARQRAHLERLRRAARDTALVTQEAETQARDLAISTDLVAEAEQCLRRLVLLCDACDDYLRRPEDPQRYDLSPRAEEVLVTYADDGGPRKRSTLAELITRIPGSVRRDRIELEGADPRRLLVQASARIHTQLQLLAQLDGRLAATEPEFDASKNRGWIAIRKAVLEALEPFPEACAAVTNRLLAEVDRIPILEDQP